MTTRGRESLLTLFDEQLQFLGASAEAYDRGFEAEAKRLAVTIRTLVHDTSQSHGLLNQLGIKDQLRWRDTAIPINPANLLPTNGLAVVKATAGGGQGATAQYVPPLEKFPAGRANRPVDFERWWETPVTKDGNNNLFSRRNFVMTVANKEGGAHVDPKLNSAYRQITEDNSLGIASFETLPETEERLERAAEGNVALASVRQIAWEVVSTLRQQTPFLLFPAGDPRRPTSALTVDSPCPCGSGRVAKSCHLANGELAIGLGNSLLDNHPLEAATAYEIAAADGQPKGSFNLGLARHGAG
jgi:SEC-C motif